jgi:hypothetical protein
VDTHKQQTHAADTHIEARWLTLYISLDERTKALDMRRSDGGRGEGGSRVKLAIEAGAGDCWLLHFFHSKAFLT